MKLVDTKIEAVAKVPAGASCFVEREGARLILKIWVRGQLKQTRRVRTTGLPVGEYLVIDGNIVHRHDPRTLIAELAAHQRRIRMESPEFVEVAETIANRLDGELERWDNDEGALLGYRIERGEDATIKDAALERIMRDFATESVLVFRAGSGGDSIGLAIGERVIDLIPQFCLQWGATVDKLIKQLDAECGVSVFALRHDLIDLRLTRKPRSTKPLRRLLAKLSNDGLECESLDDFDQELAQRRLHLWWD